VEAGLSVILSIVARAAVARRRNGSPVESRCRLVRRWSWGPHAERRATLSVRGHSKK
jgi:hypothetical protein